MGRILRASARHLFVCVFILIVSPVSSTLAQTAPEVTRGIQWLSSQVQANGTLSDSTNSVATPLQSSAETARALKLLGSVPPALIDQIAADQDGNTEYLARRILALKAASRDASADISLLVARQNPDGSFGGAPDYQSNVLDTSFALSALKTSSEASVPALKAVNYLLQLQSANGSFSFNRDASSAYVTALASSALQSVSDNIQALAAVSRANSWLLSAQKADGSWGTVAETSLVQLALVGTTSDSALQNIITASIVSHQDTDGSWGRDPYVSALALRALMARPQPAPVPVSPNDPVPEPQLISLNGAVTGQITDGANGLPIAGATVTIQQVADATAISDSLGKFAFPAVPAGNYTMTAAAAGYSARAVEIPVRSGMTTNTGLLSLTLLTSTANVGILEGTIKDSGTNLPIVGALVAVTGANNSSVNTQLDGTYRLTGLAPGLVQVTASKNGYASSSGEGTITAGNALVFSPSLKPTNTTVSLTGRIIDGVTKLPLAGVTVAVAKVGLATITGVDGRFTLAGIAGGTIAVDLTLAEYARKSFSLVIEAGVNVDVQTIALDKTPTQSTTATIQGVVNAAATGLPLQGVGIMVSGSSTLSTITGSDGSFILTNVVPGAVSVNASKTGYVTAGGNGAALAGETLIFSPRMEMSTAPGVAGQVIDNETLGAVPNATVTLDIIVAAGLVTTTDANGRFMFANVAGGNHTVTLESPGYVTRNMTITSSNSNLTDLQATKLVKTTDPVVVRGKVTDLTTNQGIARASVTILESSLSTITDEAGNYTIEGVAQGVTTIRYSAVGYTSETVILALSPYGEMQHDHALRSGQTSSLALELTTDQQIYSAYMPVLIKVQVNNAGTEAGAGTVSVIILDEKGAFLDSFIGTRLDSNGVKQNVFAFAPGATDIDLSWNTMAYAPGRYSVIVRIHQAGSDVNTGMVELAQKQASFMVDATSVIESVRLTPLPAYANLGAVEQLAYRVDAVNRSNVPVTSRLSYQLRTPGMAVIDSGTFTLEMAPAEPSKSFLLTGLQYKFLASGPHSAVLVSVDGAIPGSLDGLAISVAPGTRIDPTETLIPTSIVPDGTKRIHIELRLQGVEQK